MRRHPVFGYFMLACLISWLGVSPLILHRDVPPSWHAFGALGPVVAAVIMTAIIGGRSGLREFGGRLVRWRVGTMAWVLAVSPVIFALLAIALLAVAGAPLNGLRSLQHAFRDPNWLTGLFLASIVYGIGEEPGWRGFVLPHLQRSRSAFQATMLLGIAWGLWHIPYFFYRYRLSGIGEYLGFYFGLFAGAVWLTFLFNSTGGSTLVVIVWHTLWNAVAVAGTVIAPAVVAITSTMIVLSALLALKIGGLPHLSWTFRQQVPSPPVSSPL